MAKTKTDLAIETRGLRKYYGKQRGVEKLDLAVERGKVFGFLGPNGAGKSTTINLLMGFRAPTAGSIRLFGQRVRVGDSAIHRRLGYLPGELSMPEHLTGRELITFLGRLRGKVDGAHINQIAERFELELDRPIGTLSKGNKQKVGILQAFAHQPDLLILDEPTSGLDPLMQREFYQLVHDTQARGATVFMSSHIMGEVEHVCDRVGIIRAGQLVSVEDLAALHERAVRHLEITFVKAPPKTLFAKQSSVSNVRHDGYTVYCSVHGSINGIIKELAKYDVKNLNSEHASLEEVFFADYEEAHA